MLVSLTIENIAVIEKAFVKFEDGFNVLTGETGAGKSLLIDSLSMVLGMRTSKDIVRSGAKYASVVALFSPAPDLEELGIEPEEDGSVLLYRKLSADGKNICRINSVPVTLSLLRTAGEKLLSIHGQHDGISLLKPPFHLSLLDDFAGDKALLDSYRTAYNAAGAAAKALSDSVMSESLREQQKDILSFRISELEKAALEQGEDERLSERRNVLKNFSVIFGSLQGARSMLSSPDRACDSLYSAMKELETASKKDSSLLSLCEKVTDLYYELEEASSEINSRMADMVFSPEELDDTESRLDIIARLKKKYNALNTAELLDMLDSWRSEYDALLSYEENAELLRRKAEDAQRFMLQEGRRLEAAREEAAHRLSMLVMNELAFLDMPKVRFEVAFTDREPDSSGLRSAEFMLSTSPSEPLRPLSKIASGGELSRIMLSLRTVLTGGDEVSTLLFDEIDSGVSGRAAVKIASRLEALSHERQVICITHLPQMASRASNHLLVVKNTDTDSFRTDVFCLDENGRIGELARLISGDSSNPSAREAARDMLNFSAPTD